MTLGARDINSVERNAAIIASFDGRAPAPAILSANEMKNEPCRTYANQALLKNITRDKSRNSDPRTLTNELLRRWNDKDGFVVIVILIIIHVVIQVEKEHSPDLTADVAHQQPPGSNLAGWIFLSMMHSSMAPPRAQ